jgi:hypothetical protein
MALTARRPERDTAQAMSQENEIGLEHWRAMAKSLAFVYGVPIGIGVGVIVGAISELRGDDHSAALGLLIGFVSGALIGGGRGIWEARTKYKWVHVQLDLDQDTKWDAVVRALNGKAADQHYLMAQREPDYVAYAPTLVRPVVAGPLTVSGEYLSVVAARLNDTTLTITGPQYVVVALREALEAAQRRE